ncbi:MAG: alkaline shock response membrane anchor protein AmaP [Candidatus Omnitrophota bacterium]
MRTFTLFGLVLNMVFFIFFALGLLGLAFNIVTPLMVFNIFTEISRNPNSALILSLISALIILISVSFTQSVIGKMQREKNIAFTTPSGEVSIALAALEDLIKRIALQVPEVKSLRPDVVVGKKGFTVNLRLDLRSETSIPELTERLQELVKNKIREILRGIDEPIVVKIHVAKIVSGEEKKKSDSEPKEPAIPFYGYGR